ncbi:MAG: amino acid adenylation domain-containing protein [Planctomycetota bacterium]
MSERRDRLKNLSPAKRQLLERLKNTKKAKGELIDPVPLGAADGPFLLSFAQERFWLLEQLEPGNPAHHIPGVARFRGDLLVHALEEAIRFVTERHESLRTTFELDGDRPIQIISNAAAPSIEREDLSKVSEEERLRRRRDAIQFITYTPFDLQRGPLWRLKLLTLGGGVHELIVCLHHIIADGLSNRILANEIFSIYETIAYNTARELPDLPVQYKDYARWQRARLQGAAVERGLAYWTKKLANLTTLTLPTDSPRKEDIINPGARESLSLTPELSVALKLLAKSEGVTPFTVLLAAFKAALHRWTRDVDIVIGTPAANRPRNEVENLIGFFVNSLVLRTDISGNPTFRELIQRVKAVVTEGQSHQEFPFERIVDALQPQRRLDQNPLFQVMFNYVDFFSFERNLPKLNIKFEVAQAGSLVDLSLYVWVELDRLRLEFEYNPNLFNSLTVRSFLTQLKLILEAVVRDPSVRIQQIELLSSEDRARIVSLGTNTHGAGREWKAVHLRFDEQVRHSPGAVAIQFGDQKVTYQELYQKANAVAHLLQQNGAGRGSLVGVCLRRSPGLVACLLGILKSGAAYVPLDPDHPRERLHSIQSDAQLTVVICERETEEIITVDGIRAIRLEETINNPRPANDSYLNEIAGEADRAYVMYTSGSTGKPKGVQISHGAFSNILQSLCADPGIRRNDRLLAITTFSFDISGLELLGTLIAGATVVIAPSEAAKDGFHLADIIHKNDITVLQATPSAWRMLIDSGWRGKDNLRMWCGGEALPGDLARMLLKRGAELWNLYGPTETTIWSSVVRVTPELCNAGAVVPIGRPAGRTNILIIDEWLQIVPEGIIGELCIGGAGVSMGYLNRPDLNAEKFINISSEGNIPPGRYFKTGDLGRMRADGLLEFAGRNDSQVKIRGNRVELGEIEALLRTHSAVADAIVLVHKRGEQTATAESRLVAYVVRRRNDNNNESVAARESVDQWRLVWDEAYRLNTNDPEFDISGWIDSYTNQPMPAADMREWVEMTVARIRRLQPRRILDIGCGTGLLMWRLLQYCEDYTAIDASAPAVERLQARIDKTNISNARVHCLGAHELETLEEGKFDTIIFNSVIQYFPSFDYFVNVLKNAWSRLSPGGTIFLGDLRSLPHLEMFHESVLVISKKDALTRDELLKSARVRAADDSELAVDPALFRSIQQIIPGAAGVRVEVKAGKCDNEMTRFRYDAYITNRKSEEPETLYREYRWSNVGSLESLYSLIAREAPRAFVIEDIENRRLCELLNPENRGGVHPDDLVKLGGELGYDVQIRFGKSGALDRVDAIFNKSTDRKALIFETVTLGQAPDAPHRNFTNSPARRMNDDREREALRDALRGKLPDYMIPESLEFVDSFPITTNGKVNRAALAATRLFVKTRARAAVPPRSEIERRLAAIFSLLLRVDAIGVDDHFFELGGHSLLATRLVARVRSEFNINLTLRDLFSDPTIAGVVKAIKRLSGTDIYQITRDASGATEFPLSASQERLWFIDQLEPGACDYHMAGALRMRGKLAIEILKDSFDQIYRRHESLRMIFPSRDGVPFQTIRGDASFPIDIREVERADTENAESLQKILVAEAQKRFDLAAGPLSRAVLYKINDTEFILLFVQHHIVSDGWSIGILIKELGECYRALVANQIAALPALPIRYTDVAIGEKKTAEPDATARSLQYWKSKLADSVGFIELPADRKHPARPSRRGAQYRFSIANNVADAARVWAQQERTTLFNSFLSAFGLLLHKLTGSSNFNIGTAFANRLDQVTHNIAGLFVNTLPISLQFDGNLTFADFVRGAHETVLNADAHQKFSFEALVRELEVDRDLRRTPVFQVFFDLIEDPARFLQLTGIDISTIPLDLGIAKFDLTLTVESGAPEMSCVFEYNTDIFDGVTIERFSGYYNRILEQVFSGGVRRIAEIEIMPPDERDKILHIWARGAPACLDGEKPYLLIDAAAQRIKDAPAIFFEGRNIRYHELINSVSSLASALFARGVRRGARVCVCLDRSPELIITILAIWKAGGVYVPLDRNDPASRLERIVSDVEPALVIVNSGETNTLNFRNATEITIDDLMDTPSEEEIREFDAGDPREIAYILFTSGSTGEPKGVCVSHRSLMNHLHWISKQLDLTPRDRFLFHTTPAFDAAFCEFLPPLAMGGTVTIVNRADSRDARRIVELIAQNNITVLQVVPALLDAILECAPLGQYLRAIICGGEALRAAVAVKLLETSARNVNNIRLYNFYGPTEACIDATAFECTRSELARLDPDGVVPIGRPIAGAKCYILDANCKLVPPGASGELYIGGEGVAKGYWKRAELTAERFINNPFADGVAEILYKTGDRARFRMDGNLEFLGRMDDQVKIRGVRFELGEVEAAIRPVHGVTDVVVIKTSNSRGEERIVAFVVAENINNNDEQRNFESAVRESLAQHVSNIVIPGEIYFLSELPKTSSGKTDRRRLQNLAQEYKESDRTIKPPQSETQKKISKIWSELLQIKKIDIYDSFFQLGGHSLLATRAASRISAEFSIDLPLRKIFEAPTIAALASEIDIIKSRNDETEAPPLARVDRTGALPLSFSQERLWFLHQLEPESTMYHISGAVRIRGPLDIECLRKSIDTLVERHESLRTVFPPENGKPCQRILDNDQDFYSYEDWRQTDVDNREDALAVYLKHEARRRMDLAAGPLFRTQLICLNHEEHVLAVHQHHIISDGWSISNLWAELGILYEANLRGVESPLAPLEYQYVDFALWQRDVFSEDYLKQDIQYWAEVLSGAPGVWRAPLDFPRPEKQTYRGATVKFKIPAEWARATAEYSKARGVTLFTTLFAAFQTLVWRWSGETEFVVGTAVANRLRAEFEPIVGLFVNTIPLRSQISENVIFETLIWKVYQSVIAAQAHQSLPFEKLVEAVNPDRSLSHAPVFQVSFDLLNIPGMQSRLGGAAAEPLDIDHGTAKLDMAWSFEEDGPELSGVIEYNTDLFHKSTIERLSRAFETLLKSALAAPESKIGELELLSNVDRQEMLRDAQGAPVQYQHSNFIHTRFDEHARLQPDKVAVIDGARFMTFRELNHRADLLRGELARRNVKKGDAVAVLMGRSAELFISMIAIWKLGAVYLPLDVREPSERMAFEIRDANVRVILTNSQERPRALEFRRDAIAVDTLKDDTSIADAAPSAAFEPDDPAYIIYTSGTTGEPKGVVVPHRVVNNHIHWMIREFQIDERDRFLVRIPVGFDASLIELLHPLASGATAVVVAEGGESNAEAIINILIREKITILTVVPAMLRAIVSEKGFSECVSLRHIFCGGESLSLDLACIVLEKSNIHGSLELHNLYGPTEAGVDTACFSIDRDTIKSLRYLETVPIGRPIDNVEVYLLDSLERPVLRGSSGEIYIGGENLAMGYLGKADSTKEAFRENRIARLGKKILYKTGDLARMLWDGNIQIIGRADHQVKIRGRRIEIGEVESVLARQPGVADCAVALIVHSGRESELTGFIVINEKGAVDINRMRDSMRRFLPEAAVPVRWKQVAVIPRMQNGKVDRRALVTNGGIDISETRESEELKTAMERVLGGLWREILQIEQVGRRDRFFDLGGTSLKAIEVRNGISNRLKIDIPLKYIFEFPALCDFARIVDSFGRGGNVEMMLTKSAVFDLGQEVRLDESIGRVPLAARGANPPKNILLTGATGFLGAFLAEQLLSKTNANIHCIVRGSSDADAARRVRANLERYELFDPDRWKRIVIIRGRLDAPRLGLSHPAWDALAGEIDSIYHCGADVNFFQTYEALKPSNVDGTVELIKLAFESKLKKFHFVSTIGVAAAASVSAGGAVREDTTLPFTERLDGGYEQTKWVAEGIIQIAIERGLPAFIYRPGRIVGSSKTGAWNLDDFASRVFLGCLELGMAPDLDVKMDMTPVDFASAAITNLSLNNQLTDRVFHIINSTAVPLYNIFDWAGRCGWPLRRVPFSEWQEAVYAHVLSRPNHAMLNILPMLMIPADSAALVESVVPDARLQRLDATHCERALRGSDILCPEVSENLIKLYLNQFVKNGALSPRASGVQ